MAEYSKQFEHLLERYQQDRISISMLAKNVIGKRITAEEFTIITGEKYTGSISGIVDIEKAIVEGVNEV